MESVLDQLRLSPSCRSSSSPCNQGASTPSRRSSAFLTNSPTPSHRNSHSPQSGAPLDAIPGAVTKLYRAESASSALESRSKEIHLATVEALGNLCLGGSTWTAEKQCANDSVGSEVTIKTLKDSPWSGSLLLGVRENYFPRPTNKDLNPEASFAEVLEAEKKEHDPCLPTMEERAEDGTSDTTPLDLSIDPLARYSSCESNELVTCNPEGSDEVGIENTESALKDNVISPSTESDTKSISTLQTLNWSSERKGISGFHTSDWSSSREIGLSPSSLETYRR